MVGLLALAVGAPVALAIPPGGAKDNPAGATVVVAPAEVVSGGHVVFTGAGFAAGEEVSVKIDDGAVFKKGGSVDVLTVVTGAADGTVSGVIDLSQLNPSTPVGVGDHWIRLLSGQPRSLHADFKVVEAGGAPQVPTPAPAPGAPTPTPTPNGGSTPPGQAPGQAPPVAKAPLVEVTRTTVVVKRSKAKLRLAAGPAGSAGRLRVRTLEAFKIGRGARKRRDLFARESYLVEKVGQATITLRLTADGAAVLRRRKAFKAVVEITDATGERIKQTITVTQ